MTTDVRWEQPSRTLATAWMNVVNKAGKSYTVNHLTQVTAFVVETFDRNCGADRKMESSCQGLQDSRVYSQPPLIRATSSTDFDEELLKQIDRCIKENKIESAVKLVREITERNCKNTAIEKVSTELIRLNRYEEAIELAALGKEDLLEDIAKKMHSSKVKEIEKYFLKRNEHKTCIRLIVLGAQNQAEKDKQLRIFIEDQFKAPTPNAHLLIETIRMVSDAKLQKQLKGRYYTQFVMRDIPGVTGVFSKDDRKSGDGDD